MLPPDYLNAHEKTVLYSQQKFSKFINSNVMENGPFTPAKVFKHGIQIFHSKTKVGVDVSTQALVILRS